MNRQNIVHDLGAAPSLVRSEMTYEIRRRPEIAIPVALVVGFFLGLIVQRTLLLQAANKPREHESRWNPVRTTVRRLLH